MKPAGAHSRSSPLHSPQTSPAEKKRRFTQYLSPDPRTHFARTPGDRALDVRPPAPASPWSCQPECRLLTSPAQPPAFPAGARPKLAHHSSARAQTDEGWVSWRAQRRPQMPTALHPHRFNQCAHRAMLESCNPRISGTATISPVSPGSPCHTGALPRSMHFS